jgi:hypothetical protein
MKIFIEIITLIFYSYVIFILVKKILEYYSSKKWLNFIILNISLIFSFYLLIKKLIEIIK